jgi:FtsH-binding integral membrane protein
MDKTSFNNSSQPQQISDNLQQFINDMVEDIIINGNDFEKYKKWLKKYSESEGIDYSELEKNLNDFFELLNLYKKTKSSSLKNALFQIGESCFINKEVIEKCSVIQSVQKVSEKKLDKICFVAGRFLAIAIILLICMDSCLITFNIASFYKETNLTVTPLYVILLFCLCKYFKNNGLKKIVNVLYLLICVVAVEYICSFIIVSSYLFYLFFVLVLIIESTLYTILGMSCFKITNCKDLRLFGTGCMMTAIYYIFNMIVLLWVRDFYHGLQYIIHFYIRLAFFGFLLFTQYRIFSNAKTVKK